MLGIITQKSKDARAKRFSVQKAVLATLATAGALSVAMVAPNALMLLKYAPQHKAYLRKKYAINNVLNGAVRDGYVEFHDGKSGKYLHLTTSGKARLARLALAQLGEQKEKKKKRWDGYWRMVIYDIPTKKTGKRDMLRGALRSYGFVCLQNSVWVYPYECQEIVTLLKAEFALGKNVLYVVADTIENDKELRKYFGVHYQ